jgi:hypothetical protein
MIGKSRLSADFSRVGAELDSSAPLFKPDVQISRIRLPRIVST